MDNILTGSASFLQANSYIFIIIAIWDLVWRGLALWHASRNNQRNWFVALMVVNSVGILPMIYLKFFQRKLKINPPVRGRK